MQPRPPRQAPPTPAYNAIPANAAAPGNAATITAAGFYFHTEINALGPQPTQAQQHDFAQAAIYLNRLTALPPGQVQAGVLNGMRRNMAKLQNRSHQIAGDHIRVEVPNGQGVLPSQANLRVITSIYVLYTLTVAELDALHAHYTGVPAPGPQNLREQKIVAVEDQIHA